jgi:putative glycosyltransferase (TIGR04372 family)
MSSKKSISQWFARQLSDVRVDGALALRHMTRSAVRRLHPFDVLHSFWAFPTMLVIRSVRPIVLIRIGTLNSARIGHFVADGAEQVARLQQQSTNTVDLFWLGKTCNSQWERMIRRALPVHAWVKYVDRWNKVLPGGSAHERPSSYTRSRDVEGLYARHDVKIPFLPAESTEAFTWLRSKGWKDGEPFVCLLVRDDEYLAQDSRHGNGNPKAYEGWSYHDYRNSDIDTYVPAIQWLSGQGVWVIRMGKLMAKPLPTGMDHVIDYAFDPGKSDLLDIWLFANCNGCISTATGPDMIPPIYGKPVLFVNALPLGHFASFSNSIWVPKPLRWSDSGQLLSIKEQLTHNYVRSLDYDAAGVNVLDMTSSQITSAVQEFWQRITETWLGVQDDLDKQDHFWDVLRQWSGYSLLHGVRHPDSRVGSAWLRTLDETDSRSSDLGLP